jgi:hypothetical protein
MTRGARVRCRAAVKLARVALFLHRGVDRRAPLDLATDERVTESLTAVSAFRDDAKDAVTPITLRRHANLPDVPMSTGERARVRV